MTAKQERLPVTILTGFLGAGKTTLLQRILTEKHGKKIAVIENEFANLDIDSNLIKNQSDVLVELFNGCICCSIQGELMKSLVEIANREDPVDQIVIETTGVANPSSLVQSFLTDHLLRAVFRLDAVITIVDAKHFRQHVAESQDFKDQIAFADLLVVNKSDLVDEAELAYVDGAVREINQAAELQETTMCAIPLGRIFGRQEYENEGIRPSRIAPTKKTDLPTLVSSLSLEIHGELKEEAFMKWFQSFVITHHEQMFRTKGILHFTGMQRHVVVQGVHAVFNAIYSATDLLEKGKSRIVFIGRNLPKDEIIAGISQSLPETLAPTLGAFGFFPESSPPRPLLTTKPEIPQDLRVRIV